MMNEEEKTFIVEEITTLEEWKNKKGVKAGKLFTSLFMMLQGVLCGLDGVDATRLSVLIGGLTCQAIFDNEIRNNEVMIDSLNTKLNVNDKYVDNEKYFAESMDKLVNGSLKQIWKILIDSLSLIAVLAASNLLSDEVKTSIIGLLGSIGGLSLSRLVTNFNLYYAKESSLKNKAIERKLTSRK